MSTLYELVHSLDSFLDYDEFIASAKDISGENPRFANSPDPNVLRFAKAVVSEDSDPKFQVWVFSRVMGTQALSNATIEIISNARAMRLTDDEVMTMIVDDPLL